MSKYKIEYKEARTSNDFFWYVYEKSFFGVWTFRDLFHTEQEARSYVARKKQPPKVIYID